MHAAGFSGLVRDVVAFSPCAVKAGDDPSLVAAADADDADPEADVRGATSRREAGVGWVLLRAPAGGE
jgi:hypothetical protein